MKKLLILISISISVLLYACGNQNGDNKPLAAQENTQASATTENGNPSYDPERGEGKFSNVQLDEHLNTTMASGGEKVFGVKCAACHKLTDEKLVGPGWKGVTDRRQPEWIMNFVTNTEEMLEKDTAAQNLLEVCLVKMPNQNLSEQDARSVLEFMRKNDGKQ